MNFKLIQKLKNPEYRKAFVASQINVGIPFQIRALRKSRGWTQEQLADKAGMLQPRISAIQSPGKAKLNLETLRRLAEAFDCGLVVRFAPFSELARWSERFEPDEFSVPSFEDDFASDPIESNYLTTQLGATISQFITAGPPIAVSVTSIDAHRSRMDISGKVVVRLQNGNASMNPGIPKMPPSPETSPEILWRGMEAGNTAYAGTR
ncbi:MAG: helix-turn-helix transcriptional regulator [Acidobacteriota bacterium]